MFPIRDDNPQILTPVATISILALNVFCWFFIQGMGTSNSLASSICSFGLIPAQLMQLVPPGSELNFGSNVCVMTGSGSWLTALTSMFMHGSWMHIIGNLWFLWIFGNNVEDSMGSFRFLLFYLLCGLVAVAFQIIADPTSQIPMVGASGAIGGIMGAYILLYPKVSVHMLVVFGFYVTTFAVPAFLMLGYWFLVQVISGVGSLGNEGGGVAFWAHVGGFVAGGFFVYIFRKQELLDKHPYHGWQKRKSGSRNWRPIDKS